MPSQINGIKYMIEPIHTKGSIAIPMGRQMMAIKISTKQLQYLQTFLTKKWKSKTGPQKIITSGTTIGNKMKNPSIIKTLKV